MVKTLDIGMETLSTTSGQTSECKPNDPTVLTRVPKVATKRTRAIKKDIPTEYPSEEVLHNHIRVSAEGNFEEFIRLVFPKQVFGHVHIELCNWLSRQDAKDHQLVLLPRDHGKSRIVGFYTLWMLTKFPWLRILYISSTAGLAEQQLFFIKEIMNSPTYRKYWPEMTHVDEGKRKKWTFNEIKVDHPERVSRGIRDPSILAAGVEKSITGFHFDLVILDDVVVRENAYNEEGRGKVKMQYSLLASIEAADAKEVTVGTRYDPSDLYADMLAMEYVGFDDDGNELEPEKIYEVFERQVEDRGDGTGQFLWPLMVTGKDRYGFNSTILAKKKAKYVDQTQFRAQYYNDPNDTSTAVIGRDKFQYYDPALLKYDGRHWFYRGNRLNLVAAIDFAYSTQLRADYSAIVVVGIDSDRRYFVLEIDRFKTTAIKDYYQHILELYKKWDFKKLVAEATAAQESIVNELKNSYIIPNGIMLSIVHEKPTRHEGSKEERTTALVQPLYENQQVWHYRSGNCQILEEELVLQRPPHDDCKDALANCFKYAVPPQHNSMSREGVNVVQLRGHPKFGGLG